MVEIYIKKINCTRAQYNDFSSNTLKPHDQLVLLQQSAQIGVLQLKRLLILIVLLRAEPIARLTVNTAY